MGKYLFATIISLAALVCSAAVSFGATLRSAFDFAFPVAAARDRMPISALQSESVIYGAARSRIRAFRARLNQRHDDRAGFGVLGLPALA